jgi:2',3'-cyclic-nucleotide 2'-phosphodiesterase (5'-nucleotidase family)
LEASKSSNPDFAFVNWGMIRTNWPIGNLSYYDLFETIPFNDEVCSFEATGAELVKIMETLQCSNDYFYPISNFQQIFSMNPKKLKSISFYNGTEIEYAKTYRIATTDFVVNGGDDFSKVLPFFTPRNKIEHGNIRDNVASFVKKYGSLNPVNNPIVNPLKPRIVIEKNSKASNNFLEKLERIED